MINRLKNLSIFLLIIEFCFFKIQAVESIADYNANIVSQIKDYLGSTKLKPKATLLAWDLHDVLINDTPDKWGDIQAAQLLLIKNITPKLQNNENVDLENIMQQIKDKTESLSQSKSNSEFFDILEQKHPEISIEYLTVDNPAQKPIKDSLKLLNKFYSEGFNNCVFSNLGTQAYSQLQKRIPTISKILNDKGWVSHIRPGKGYITKPMPEAYQEFLEKIQSDYSDNMPKLVIFIDDWQDNVQVANKIFAANKNPNFKAFGIIFENANQLKKIIRNLQKKPRKVKKVKRLSLFS